MSQLLLRCPPPQFVSSPGCARRHARHELCFSLTSRDPRLVAFAHEQHHRPAAWSAMDQLIWQVSELAAIGAPLFSLADLRSRCAENGTATAVRDHDTPALFDWLADVLSYQGVSDAIAERYMDKHGSISFYEIEGAHRQRPSCPRLTSYWQFAECRFAKTAHTCSEPAHLSACPVPRHDLRNGRLNQTAYALFFFPGCL